MEDDGFYITLPSKASKNLFPENTSASFTVRLFKPLDLRGEWEAGLVEIQYPHNWYTFTKNASFWISEGANSREYHVRSGYYYDLCRMSDFMNITVKRQPGTPLDLQFYFDPTCAMLRFNGPDIYSVTMSEELAHVMGAPPNVPIKRIHNCRDITGGFNTLYLYTDIIEHQLVGDTAVPLLHCVPVQRKPHDFITVTYDEPHYVPINKHHVETIHIEIKTDQNQAVSFRYGKVIVRLHLRPWKKW